MKGFRELKSMILQYMYAFKKIINENLSDNKYKKEIWYAYWYIRDFERCAAAERHPKIFDHK
jgi:hypothetical protein